MLEVIKVDSLVVCSEGGRFLVFLYVIEEVDFYSDFFLDLSFFYVFFLFLVVYLYLRVRKVILKLDF